MKKVKILLDILMFIILIVLMMLYVFNNRIHEIAGILLILSFIIHKLINIKSIKVLWKSFISGTASNKVKNIVISDIILTILMVISCISGIFISKFIFRIRTSLDNVFYLIHIVSIYITIFIVLYHMLNHIKNILLGICNILNIKYNKRYDYMFYILLIICSFTTVFLFIANETLNKIKNIYNISQVSKKEEVSTTKRITTKPDNEITVTTRTTQKIVDQPTEDEIYKYLSNLFCNGCNKHCPLSAPQCVIGEQNAAIEEASYRESYSQGN